jgi:hypothetical protein
VPLVDFLCSRWDLSSLILVVYELNGPIRFVRDKDRREVRRAWSKWRQGLGIERSDEDDLAIRRMLATTSKERASLERGKSSGAEHFDRKLHGAIGRPTVALEILRQMCLCSRTLHEGKPLLARNLVIFFEGADLVLPDAPVHNLSDADRHRVAICQDWFLDPGFQRGGDSVLMLCESRSLLNQRVARLPQILGVEVSAPDEEARLDFVDWFRQREEVRGRVKLWGSPRDLAQMAAGLTLHALWQLLQGITHEERALTPGDVVGKVEEHVQRELGEDIVEFKRPHHHLENLIGFRALKEFLRGELIPRFQIGGEGALSGATVCGPIGAGKTFVFEAVAAELDMPVLVLKSIRSQWFGQTDVILERLQRVLAAFSKVLIFVDEADTQFGGVGAGGHSTERRLTGKIQAMMSDPRLRGRVLWLLMTARVHLLSPDIRRPGRAGDLIIPVLDPEGPDRHDFLRWVVADVWQGDPGDEDLKALDEATQGYFAASFASLRAELKSLAARSSGSNSESSGLDRKTVLEAVQERLAPPLGPTRRYQKLQALVNCTRRSLLPEGEDLASEERREAWVQDIRALEAQGIH